MQIESSSSRLNTFKESKENIIKIFADISDYINDCNEFLRSIHESGAQFQALINADEVKSLSSLVEKVKRIKSVISRDYMKCVFFGRTSNGKSTTINAMLGDRILPASIGYTTSCFLEIRGTKESQGSVSIISSPRLDSYLPPVEYKQIDLVHKLAQAVSTTKLPTDSLIRITWPSQKCALLSEDVVLLDSPGFNNYPDIDQCIDKYCLDADVFVLVVNSVSTLNQSEMAFFRKVCGKLSKPNVFILNNRWDASDKNPNSRDQIRNQHLQRCVSFLTEDLQVCSKMEAEKRVFFVSAKEVLSERCKNLESESGFQTTMNSLKFNQHSEGWQSRLDEFRAFEEILGKTLSESATKTKFAAHSSQGQDIVEKVRCIMEALNEKAKEQKDSVMLRNNEIQSCCHDLTTKRTVAHDTSTEEILQLSTKVIERVSAELRKEMLHLDDVIKEFNQKFSDKPEKLDMYKIALNQHVEHHFRNKIRSIYEVDLKKQVDAVSTAILERYRHLVQNEHLSTLNQAIRSEYVGQFDINCNKISSDLHQDLSSSFNINMSEMDLLVLHADTKESIKPIYSFGQEVGTSALPLGKVLLAAGLASLLVGAVAYVIKQSTWMQEKKEKEFKTEYQSYVANNIEPVIVQASKHIAEQIKSVMEETLKELDKMVDGYMHRMRAGIAQLESDIKRYEEIFAESGKLKNTAQDLEKVLKNFHHKYILV